MTKSVLNIAADMKVSLEDELPVILLREYELESHVKGKIIFIRTHGSQQSENASKHDVNKKTNTTNSL